MDTTEGSTDVHRRVQVSALIPYAPRQVGTETIQTVDGRDIHAFLGVARDYSDWVKRQIKSGQLIENRDFIIFHNRVENSGRGRPSTEYHFTFRAAEHLGMMSRTTKGREIREYFLDLEDQTRTQALSTTPGEVALALAQAVVSIERRQLAIEARQDAQAETLRVITERQPPVGRCHPTQWLKHYGKPRLPRETLDVFRAACKRREEPEYFRPDGYDNMLPYYSLAVLIDAYTEATRQLSFSDAYRHEPVLRAVPSHQKRGR